MSILIADAGSTKTDWRLVARDGRPIANVRTDGFNAALCAGTEAAAYFKTAAGLLGPASGLYGIFYYGAGCASPDICRNIEEALTAAWPGVRAEAASDMLGAARALCGRSEGIACILGTGSNSAYYDGEKIRMNVPPLGFILGDEGSGSVIGKKLVADIYKGTAPERIVSLFSEKYSYSPADIIRLVYRTPAPNRFLASFAPFVRETLDRTAAEDHAGPGYAYLHNLVKETFRSFLKRNVAAYPAAERLPVNFIGSISVAFAGILEEAVEEEGMQTGKILGNPLQGLTAFHTEAVQTTS